jgi:betaine reductase
LRAKLADSLRSYEEAISYLPNQVFIGAAHPQPLGATTRPWWRELGVPAANGLDGSILDQASFLEAMQRVDPARLIEFSPEALETSNNSHVDLVSSLGVKRTETESGGRTPISGRERAIGSVAWGHPDDESLSPSVMLENLATKTSAALALADCITRSNIDPQSIDFVISCSEEAVGDRYQRGGGNLGKAIAEAVGANRASGFDIKNFCAAPIPALVVASSLIQSGVASVVAVAAGGSVPKLGMKFQGHLKNGMPVLEDCLGAFAVVLAREGIGPTVRLDAVGRHSVGAGGSNQAIFRELVIEPLEHVGLKATDVDLIGTEMHNPELTEPQGSGDVPLRNYRMIAALAAAAHHIDRDELESYLAPRAVAGFAPTQGHIASAICLLPHATRRLAGGLQRALLVAKGSLFLGKMSALSDGMSIMIES